MYMDIEYQYRDDPHSLLRVLSEFEPVAASMAASVTELPYAWFDAAFKVMEAVDGPSWNGGRYLSPIAPKHIAKIQVLAEQEEQEDERWSKICRRV